MRVAGIPKEIRSTLAKYEGWSAKRWIRETKKFDMEARAIILGYVAWRFAPDKADKDWQEVWRLSRGSMSFTPEEYRDALSLIFPPCVTKNSLRVQRKLEEQQRINNMRRKDAARKSMLRD